ncbi:uncharacterized protein LOC119693077 [Plutella xylostella]|uniref:uncharacterized protein LOC119693077 n=1 Tax=Plutella xylostella TaxID=51655 RepID=UPI0020322D43|nr:uncharacterized protein LOC119693077 [Plutella xylostella]
MTSEQKFNCVFCKESFEDKETLQIHFRKHADPTFNKPIQKTKKPQDEAQLPAEKPTSKMEMVSCDVCSEEFPSISKAITHKHKMHPDHDAKYFCPWCGKLFTLKHLFNKHMVVHESLVSDEEQFHCDSCEVNFHLPSAMIYHNKFFHRQDMELLAIGHSKKQKLIKEELVSLYYCAFCGEEYINKVNLHKHMADDHGDENQSPDEVLRCPRCLAIFYHLDAYEVHLTFHSVEDLYSSEVTGDKDLTDFTLESVPPILEKVEDCEPEEEADNAMDIGDLLGLTADSNDPAEDNQVKVKHKKHKKHKKSKKEKAITLDEFLNMNTDVFGDDLDFQGVEEVPTKVVTKKIIAKPKPQLPPKAKFISKTELEKLKQQGIVVKMNNKPVIKPTGGIKIAAGVKIASGNFVKNSNTNSQIKSSPQILTKNINEEVLSKLSQTQIKIVKKSADASSSHDVHNIQQNVSIRPRPSESEECTDNITGTPENIEVECDVVPKSSEPSSEIDREDLEEDVEAKSRLQEDKSTQPAIDKGDVEPNIHENPKTDAQFVSNNRNEIEKQKTDPLENNDLSALSNHTHKTDIADKNKLDSMNVLKHISQNITIKQLKNSEPRGGSPISRQTNSDLDKGSDVKVLKNSNFDGPAEPLENPPTPMDNSGGKASLNVLKNLGQHITVKSPITKQVTSSSNIMDNIDTEANQNVSENIKNEKNTCKEHKTEKSLNVLKNLGITVKSSNTTATENTPKDKDSIQKIAPEDTSKNFVIKDNHKKPTETSGKSLDVLKNLGITVKSSKLQIENDKCKANEEMEADFEEQIQSTSINKPVMKNYNVTEKNRVPPKSNVLSNEQSIKQSPLVQSKPETSENESNDYEHDEPFTDDEEESHKDFKMATMDSNITQKLIAQGIIVKPPSQSPKSQSNVIPKKEPVSQHVTKHIQQRTGSNPITRNTVNPTVKMNHNIKQKSCHDNLIDKESNDEPEIFSIDDTDSEEDEKPSHNTIKKTCAKKANTTNLGSFDKSLNVSRNIKKETNNEQTQSPKNCVSDSELCEDNDYHSSEDETDQLPDDTNHNSTQSIAKLLNNKNISLKNLRSENYGQITHKKDLRPPENKVVVRSNDDETNRIKSFDNFLSNESSDDDGIPAQNVASKKESNIKHLGKDLTVKALRDDDNSPLEDFDDDYDLDDEPTESESQTVINKLKSMNKSLSIKSNNPNQSSILNKSINKSVTVKSHQTNESAMKTSRVLKRESSESYIEKTMGTNHNLSIKPCKQSKFTGDDDDTDLPPTNQTKPPSKQIAVRPANQRVVQHQTSAVNNYNQEATTSVKTIQTKTVVQEITTTVTRTIKTINQEVSNSSQVTQNVSGNPTPIRGRMIVKNMRPQIQGGMRGVSVRPAAPGLQGRRPPAPRGANTAVRSARPAPPRPAAPPPRPTFNKPLKISPNLMKQMKVKNAPEPEQEGHFSCFKRPRESLIPDAGDSVESVCTSQVSKSNFSSCTKTVKGNSVVTATQTQSEVHSSMRAVSARGAGANTLAAIEKLQRLGLAVKRPRPRQDDDDEPHSQLAIESGH